MRAYSDQIRRIECAEASQVDVVLIDGRFPVACCLKCYDILSDDSVILFDDFLNRPQYHVVLDFFEIVEQTVDKRMVVLKKRPHKSIPPSLIQKYELERG